jgi:lipopolysaccharide biosynthesis protein
MIRHAKNSIRSLIITNPYLYKMISEGKSRSRHILKLRFKDAAETRKIKKHYADEIDLTQFSRRDGVKIAVVLHLFYAESWWMFKAALKNLQEPYDLFVSLPEHNIAFAERIKENYKNAFVFVTPNRGRDVLPFVKIASELDRLGYTTVLKLHSKKSPHRKDGAKWFKTLLSNLLPANKKVMDQLMSTLQNEDTGIVGPKGQYISLMVNFPPNGPRIAEALSNIYSPKITDKLIRARRQHGFFAGTMFWARLDAIRPILDRQFNVHRFDPERGQIDATFAHALERVFCLVPQIEKKNLYEIGSRGVKKIPYKTDNIPDWSAVYIGPKPERRKRKKR